MLSEVLLSVCHRADNPGGFHTREQVISAFGVLTQTEKQDRHYLSSGSLSSKNLIPESFLIFPKWNAKALKPDFVQESDVLLNVLSEGELSI